LTAAVPATAAGEFAAEHLVSRRYQGRKLAYYGHTMRKQRSCLEKEIMQRTMPGACRRGRRRTAWMDNIKTWTGLPGHHFARAPVLSSKCEQRYIDS